VRRTSRTRRTLERLFGRLSSKAYPQDERSIVVNYPRRFIRGKCLVAAFIPSNPMEVQKIRESASTAELLDSPEATTIGDGNCLCLVWRYPNMRLDEPQRLLQEAQKRAAAAEQVFKMKAIVSPLKNLLEVRQKAHTH